MEPPSEGQSPIECCKRGSLGDVELKTKQLLKANGEPAECPSCRLGRQESVLPAPGSSLPGKGGRRRKDEQQARGGNYGPQKGEKKPPDKQTAANTGLSQGTRERVKGVSSRHTLLPTSPRYRQWRTGTPRAVQTGVRRRLSRKTKQGGTGGEEESRCPQEGEGETASSVRPYVRVKKPPQID